MIKYWEQAVSIQAKRVDAGKIGYSKAVRRFIKRDIGSLEDLGYWNVYLARKSILPNIGGTERLEGSLALADIAKLLKQDSTDDR